MKKTVAILALLVLTAGVASACGGTPREVVVGEVPANQLPKEQPVEEQPKQPDKEIKMDDVRMPEPKKIDSKNLWFSRVLQSTMDGNKKVLVWQDENGSPRKLSELGGKAYLVDVWAQWCGPCRASTPKLLEWYAKYKDKGLVVVGINIDQVVDIDKAKKFAKEEGIDYPIFYDTSGQNIGGIFVASGIPNFTLLDKDGNFVTERTGAIVDGDPNTDQLEKLIMEKLGLAP